MDYLNEVTGGMGAMHIDTLEVGRDYAKCHGYVYGKALLTRRGKKRVFRSEEAAIKACANEIKQLRKQAEADRKIFLANLSDEEKCQIGIIK